MPLPYTKLNPNSRGGGNFAPHKPLLLLCIFDMANEGEINSSRLEKTPGLRLRFDAYWAIVQARWGGLPGLDQPFHYLRSQGFWTTHTKRGETSTADRSTDYLELSDVLMADLADPKRRDEVRRTLVEKWFPEPEQQALYAAFGWSPTKLRQIEWNDSRPATPPRHLKMVAWVGDSGKTNTYLTAIRGGVEVSRLGPGDETVPRYSAVADVGAPGPRRGRSAHRCAGVT